MNAAPRWLSIGWWGALLLVLGIGAYAMGHRHASNACAAERLAALSRAITQAERLAREDAEVMAAHVEQAEQVRVVYRTITSEVKRYVDTHPDVARCGLDADGLRLWNAANAGTQPVPAGPVGP